jgi:hypothetical protein
MARGVAVGLLSGYTSQQWGMVTAAQARALGVSRVDIGRLIVDGALEAVPGAARVYCLAGAPVDPDLDPVRAVWLQLGNAAEPAARLREPDAVVAARSAALVLRLGDLSSDVHEFYVTRRRQPRRRDVRLRVRHLPRTDWQITDGLPVCAVPRIVTDLLNAHEDGQSVAQICRDALALGLSDRTRLTAAISAHTTAYQAPPDRGPPRRPAR